MNLTNPFRTQLIGMPFLNDFIDHMFGAINAIWQVEHNLDGTHGDVTADSIDVAEGVTVGTDVIAEGDIVALAGTGEDSGIGTLASVDGTPLLPAEIVRQGLLLGGVSLGTFFEWRDAVSPFLSGKELAVWNLGHSTTRPLFRVGVLAGIPTLIDGGSGVSLALGDLSEPLVSVNVNTLTVNTQISAPFVTQSGANVIPAVLPTPQAVNNAAAVVIGDNSPSPGTSGFFFVEDVTNALPAIFYLRAGANDVTEVSDPAGVYSTTAGTAASRNVYWSAGNIRYEFENNSGGAISVRMWMLGSLN